MTDMPLLRAEAAKARAAANVGRGALPTDEVWRGRPEQPQTFPHPPEFRAEMVQREGLDFYLVEGYASMVERGYEMWDMFGPYQEIVTRSAFDKTLAAKPEVVFRFNHGGTPMANTNDNGRLELWADSMGLGTRAWINPKRADVQELITAIEDRDVREQSFMFQIDDGEWNDDYSIFRINEVDMNRGDVGPVTYGANPHTIIAARAGQVLEAIPDLPVLAAREAMTRLSARADLTPVSPVSPKSPAVTADDGPTGTSLQLLLAQLEVDKQNHL
jgi:HK97 family phage prohead protease